MRGLLVSQLWSASLPTKPYLSSHFITCRPIAFLTLIRGEQTGGIGDGATRPEQGCAVAAKRYSQRKARYLGDEQLTNSLSSTGVFSILFLAAAASAQSDEAFEEIYVTATKRSETLQDVPVAVSVIDAEVLDRAQINDIVDLQSLVPSLRVTQLQTSGNTNFVIRGFGNGANNVGIEPSVGVFIDGVYRSRTAGALGDLPNLERVEVLRGPQSTLFGKNASAGVISVVTAAPDIDAYSGTLSLTAGNYDQMILKGSVTGPLSDSVAFSLAGSVNQRDGYFENLVSGTDINGRNRWGIRGQMLWLPSTDSSWRLIIDADRIDEACCGVSNLLAGPTVPAIEAIGGQVNAENPFARAEYYDFDPSNKIDNSGVSLQGDIDFDNGILLTTITAFRKHARFENADVDFTSATLIDSNTLDTDIDTFTQEVRLSQSNEELDWLLGAFYFHESVDLETSLLYGQTFRAYADILSANGVSDLEAVLGEPAGTYFAEGIGSVGSFGQEDDTFSVFGQMDWHLSDRATLTAGLNYTAVKKDVFATQTNTDTFSALDMVALGFDLTFSALTGLPPTPDNIAAFPDAALAAQSVSMVPCSAETAPNCNELLGLQALQFLPPMVAFPNTVESGMSDDDKITWTVRLAFDATEDINVYASAGTGFKASSWNLSRDTKPFPEDVDALMAAGVRTPFPRLTDTRFASPEDATVYELGLKGRWNRSTVNVALFRQKIEGFQSNLFIGTGFTLANAGQLSTDGLELEAIWAPIDDLVLSFAGTFLDPVYDSFPLGTGTDGAADLSGETPAGIHGVSLNLSGTYSFDLGSDSRAFVRAEYVYEDEIQVVDNISKDTASRKVNVVNASSGIEWDNGMKVLFWVRNLTDDEYLLSAFPSVAQTGSVSGYPNQPRTYGISFEARFD